MKKRLLVWCMAMLFLIMPMVVAGPSFSEETTNEQFEETNEELSEESHMLEDIVVRGDLSQKKPGRILLGSIDP